MTSTRWSWTTWETPSQLEESDRVIRLKYSVKRSSVSSVAVSVSFYLHMEANKRTEFLSNTGLTRLFLHVEVWNLNPQQGHEAVLSPGRTDSVLEKLENQSSEEQHSEWGLNVCHLDISVWFPQRDTVWVSGWWSVFRMRPAETLKSVLSMLTS